MKATGIVRRVDDLGRIVIPKNIRQALHILDGEPMEIFVDENKVIFQKYETNDLDIREHVRKYIADFLITGVLSDGCENFTISFSDKNGDSHISSVKRYFKDEFDMNMAIYFAIRKCGFDDPTGGRYNL